MRFFRRYIIVLTALIAITLSCKQNNAVPETEPEETVEPVPVPTMRWGINIDSLDVEDGVIGRNELLSTILYRYDVSSQTIYHLEKASQETWSVRRMQSGKPYHVVRDRDSVAKARYFVYDINKTDYAVYSLTDSIFSYTGSIDVDTVLNYISGSIESSLWNAMIDQGAAPDLAGMLADIYSWTIDFFGIQRRDSFSVYYQELYADSVRVATGEVLAANFITSGTDHYAFRYNYHNERGEYFDENGTSLRRAFLKAP